MPIERIRVRLTKVVRWRERNRRDQPPEGYLVPLDERTQRALDARWIERVDQPAAPAETAHAETEPAAAEQAGEQVADLAPADADAAVQPEPKPRKRRSTAQPKE